MDTKDRDEGTKEESRTKSLQRTGYAVSLTKMVSVVTTDTTMEFTYEDQKQNDMESYSRLFQLIEKEVFCEGKNIVV